MQNNLCLRHLHIFAKRKYVLNKLSCCNQYVSHVLLNVVLTTQQWKTWRKDSPSFGSSLAPESFAH